MMKVIVADAAGRMGRRIGYMADQHPSLADAWLEGKANGMYALFDVLDLNDF